MRTFLLTLLFSCSTLAHEIELPGLLGNLLAGTYFWEEVSLIPALPPKADALLRESLKDVPYIIDMHMHLLGTETGKTGCHVHPDQSKHWWTLEKVKQRTISAASGVKQQNVDDVVVRRTRDLVERFPYFTHYYSALLAFAPTYDLETGVLDKSLSSLIVPNEYVLKVCSGSNHFIAAGSVHPYDPDAIQKLRELKSRGIHLIKWLPNAQRIRADNEKSLRFLGEMARLKMVLITHVGDEHAVTATGVDNASGNPDLFRIALNKFRDLHIIFAHVGSEGYSNINGKKLENFELVIDILKTYPKQAFADISAFSSAFKRVKYLPRLLEEKGIHGQLVYGTDYPLAAVGGLSFWTTKYMWSKGLISFDDSVNIHIIYRHNPLAAAFVTMRKIRYKGISLPKEIFYKNARKVFHDGHMPLLLAKLRD